MKKTIFHGFAALVILAVLSCGIDEQKQSGGYITLNVSESSESRALDGTIAEAVTNFYEATFQKVSDSKIIRATWNYAQRGKIYIEPGEYKLILMAGRNGIDKALLGVGQATGIGGGGSISTDNSLKVTITAATTDLYFHAYPLMNDIKGADGSTFTTEISTFPFPPTQFEKDEFGNDVPVFMITQGGETEATWSFGLGDLAPFVNGVTTPGDGKHGFPGSGDQINVFGSNILVARTPDLPVYTPFDPITSFTTLVAASFPDELTAGTPINGTFEMKLKAPNATGKVQLSFEIPVVAIETSDKPVIWYIRGGLNNGALDAGIDPINKAGVVGGAILLEF